MIRCHFCQQEIRHDGYAWFHTGRALTYCLPIPGYGTTYATPEQK